MNPHIFREYDIRGIAEDDLTDDVVENVGKAYGTYLKNKGLKNFIVGGDVRLTTPRLKTALIRGITSTGGNVTDIGIAPTPVVYYGIVHTNADGGIAVTGSHNPIEYNGFKMCQNGTSALFGQEIQELRKVIESGKFAEGEGSVSTLDILDTYKQMIKDKLNITRPLKIVIDAGNGTAGEIAPEIFESFGCEVIQLYCEPDGTFPNHLPDPTVVKYAQDLIQKVKDENADIGIGYDGDSDRVGAIDNLGRMIYGDRILALFARDFLERCPGETVIFDVKCSQTLPEDIEKHGGKPLMWKTGHSLLKAKMKETHALLAGEMSGHMFFAENFFGFDDAIYASGVLVQYLSKQDKPFSAVADSMTHYYSTPEVRVDCDRDDVKFQIVEEVKTYFQEKYDTIDVDGIRALFGDGWGLIRASNTQPVLVLRCEAQTQERLKEIVGIMTDQLRKYPTVKINENDFHIK